ncbi:MAG: prolyl oligopeptidase family serine peptidase [Mycobacteriales bacterium]
MAAPAYPFADRDETVETLHGHRIADPYRYLEDRTDVATIEWEAAQEYLTTPLLAGLPGRRWLSERLTGLLRCGAVSPPVWRGDREFFTRRDPDQEHAAVIVRQRGAERVLLDPGEIDPTGTTTLDTWAPSVDGGRLAYQLSTGGDEESQLYVIDVATGERLDGPIDRCRYSPIGWLAGGAELYYVRRLAPADVPAGEEQFHRRVYRHRVGADPETDLQVHGAGLDPTNYYDVHISRDGRWLTVTASAGTAPRNDVWIADLGASPGVRPDLLPVQIDVDARCEGGVQRDGLLYLSTDRDAPRGRVVAVDPAKPAYEGWHDVVPERPDAVLEDWTLLDHPDGPVALAAHAADAASHLTWYDAGTGAELGQVDDPGGRDAGDARPATIGPLTSDPDGGPNAWLGYTDHVTPPSVRTWSVTRPATVAPYAEAPGSADTSGVRVIEDHCTSADGTRVHMFVLAGDAAPTAPRPAILWGYGGFDIALTPAYAATALAWVRAGGVWAIANLRGGSENGQEWHRAGMREHKQNVFDDFAAAARFLLTENWTTPSQLAVFGGSNGGLLVGAAVTQFPELMAAAVCSAPLLDMVRYERFGLGRTWNDEYGTAEDPTELGWLVGYSPYHRVVEATAYPAVLFTVFGSDTRVDPVHARKMCAALQWATTGDGPILLRSEADVGHGARSVSRTVGLAVDQLAFLADRLGLALPA